MITIYTVSKLYLVVKSKTWLNAHQLTYKEQNLGKEGHHQRGTSGYFNQNRKWYREHCFIKNRYAKGLGVDIEELSVNEVLDIIMETRVF